MMDTEQVKQSFGSDAELTQTHKSWVITMGCGSRVVIPKNEANKLVLDSDDVYNNCGR